MKSYEWAGVGNVVKTFISSSTCSTGCSVGVYFSVAYRSEGVSAQPMKLQQVHASAEEGAGGGSHRSYDKVCSCPSFHRSEREELNTSRDSKREEELNRRLFPPSL